jgi:hypothetical protein
MRGIALAPLFLLVVSFVLRAESVEERAAKFVESLGGFLQQIARLILCP